MATYTLADGTRKTQLTISGDTTVVFPTKLDYFGVRSLDGANILVSKIKAPTTLEDGVYSTDEGDGDVVVDDGVFTDTLYLKGTGTVVVYGGAKSNHLPFKATGKGGDDGGTLRMLGATTTPLSDGATTNPITIDGQSVTAEKNDVAIYNTREFYFSGTTWSEFGGQMDTVPTQGSANAVTSDGVYKYTAGQKEYTSNMLKGEIFNTYTGSDKNVASGNYSHAEGNGTTASGNYSHVEGSSNTASGNYSHAEGNSNTASKMASHVEGGSNTASGTFSHAEGFNNTASGVNSHVEGSSNTASGENSHAGGENTIATAESSTVIGRYNVADGTGASDPKHLFIVGNGSSDNARSNIVEVNAISMNVNGDIQQNGVPLRATTMPTITASMLGKVVQYVGTSDSNYKQGWNYVAVSDGAAEPTYSWRALMDTAPTSGSNNPVTSDGVYNDLIIKRGTGTGSGTGGVDSSASGYNGFSFGHYASASGETSAAFGFRTIANRQYMMAVGRYNLGKIGSIFEIGNGNFATGQRSNILEVSTAKMNVNGDIQRNGVGIDDYTTTERKIGKWIDGSDLYQRTFEISDLAKNTWHTSLLGTTGIDIVDLQGFVEWYKTSDDTLSARQPLSYFDNTNERNEIFVDSTGSDLSAYFAYSGSTQKSNCKAVITIKYTKPSVQANALNANIQQTEEPTDEMR